MLCSEQPKDVFYERGAVYVLITFVLSVVIALSVLLIDGVAAYVSNEQQLHTCEYISLAALTAFTEADPLLAPNPSDPEQVYVYRLSRALESANEVAIANDMLSPHSKEAQKPFEGLTMSQASLASPAQQLSFGQTGVLRPGRWTNEPTECATPPCFVENAVGERSVTAFRCELSLSSPITTLIGAAIGVEELSIGARAVAAMAPKSMAIVMDMSSSMMRTTHLTRNPHHDEPGSFDPPIPRPFSCGPYNGFLTRPGIASNYSVDVLQYGPELDTPAVNVGGKIHRRLEIHATTPIRCLDGNFSSPKYEPQQVSDLPETPELEMDRIIRPKQRPFPTAPFERYKSDYTHFKFTNSATDTSPCVTQASLQAEFGPLYPENVVTHPATEVSDYFGNKKCWLIDTYRYTETNYQDPSLHPLWWNSFASFPEEFAYRGPEPFTSLLVGVELIVQEFIARSNGQDRLGLLPFDEKVIPASVSPPFRTFPLSAPHLLQGFAPPNDPHTQIHNGLFVRSDMNTNLALGLIAAREQLLSEGVGALDAVLISDGLTNCTIEGACIPNRSGHEDSVYQIRLSGLVDTFLEAGIRIHVLQLPNPNSSFASALPHTLNILRPEYISLCGTDPNNPAPECQDEPRWMNDQEAIKQGVPFVKPSWYGGPGGNWAFGPDILLWELASETGGRFVPLRPPPPAALDSCNTTTGESNCAALDNLGNCVPRGAFSNPQKQELDPFCRSIEEQIADFMKETVNFKNGIRLVG